MQENRSASRRGPRKSYGGGIPPEGRAVRAHDFNHSKNFERNQGLHSLTCYKRFTGPFQSGSFNRSFNHENHLVHHQDTVRGYRRFPRLPDRHASLRG